jgi:hypothetical protein
MLVAMHKGAAKVFPLACFLTYVLVFFISATAASCHPGTYMVFFQATADAFIESLIKFSCSDGYVVVLGQGQIDEWKSGDLSKVSEFHSTTGFCGYSAGATVLQSITGGQSSVTSLLTMATCDSPPVPSFTVGKIGAGVTAAVCSPGQKIAGVSYNVVSDLDPKRGNLVAIGNLGFICAPVVAPSTMCTLLFRTPFVKGESRGMHMTDA